MKKYIHSNDAPRAVGCYSQAVRVNDTVYLSGQIGLDPASMELMEGIEAQMHQTFKNLRAVVDASGGSFANIVKLNVFLTNMQHFALLNEVMADYFTAPYPARAAIAVADLPKGALFEVDGILAI